MSHQLGPRTRACTQRFKIVYESFTGEKSEPDGYLMQIHFWSSRATLERCPRALRRNDIKEKVEAKFKCTLIHSGGDFDKA